MFESRTEPLLSLSRFARRVLVFLLLGAAVDALNVLAGALGFRATEQTGWLDAVLDAALTVTGNGPRHAAASDSAKVFLATYALLGTIAFAVVIALVLAPAVHRVLHALHLRSPADP